MVSNIVYNIDEKMDAKMNEKMDAIMDSYGIGKLDVKMDKIHNEIIDIVDDGLKNNFNNFEFNSMVSSQLFYEDNYTKKEIDLIADYYSISKRKKRKAEIIQDIVLYEINPENEEISQKRKLMWFYISEIESDSYLRKFLIFK